MFQRPVARIPKGTLGFCLGLILLAQGFLAPQAQAQVSPEIAKKVARFLAVDAWKLTYTLEANDGWKYVPLKTSCDLNLKASLSTVLRHPDAQSSTTFWTNERDQGTAQNISYQADTRSKVPDLGGMLNDMAAQKKGTASEDKYLVNAQTDWAAKDASKEHHSRAGLQINAANGTYTIGGTLYFTQVKTYTCGQKHDQEEKLQTLDLDCAFEEGRKINTLPESGTTLSGSNEFYAAVAPFDQLEPYHFKIAGMPQCVPYAKVKVNWTLTPLGDDQPEVVVELENYDSWVPEAGQTEDAPGNTLTIRAFLQEKDGQPSRIEAKQIIFELKDTSQIAGVCCNFPQNAKTSVDMKFDPTLNPKLNLENNFQMAKTEEDAFSEARAVVTSYDFGGYADLVVKAIMFEGPPIVGYLKGDKSKTKIPLPKRTGDSKVADAWKADMGVADLPDNDDSDDEPQDIGDGHKGDGLTLFEEYRGFMENAKHIRLDPKTKDLFIVDKLGGRSKDGIALVRNLTGYAVHDELIPNVEADAQGVVNRNAALFAGLKPTTKWATIIEKSQNGGPGSSGLTGGPKTVHMGMPGQASPATGPGGWNTAGQGRILTDRYASALAHEILHTLGADEHGHFDPADVLWTTGNKGIILEYPLDSSGKVQGQPQVIRVFLESGKELKPGDTQLKLPNKLYVAEQNCEHSGAEDCIMRYDFAQAYIYPKGSSTRYLLLEPEMTGIGLCDSTEGVATVKVPGQMPRTRYGSAAKGHGNCKHLICVNDAYTHSFPSP